jgi:uncharacterized protein
MMAAQALLRWLPRHPPAGLPSRAAPRLVPADFAPALRTRLLILQPTPFCNIDCDYCYLPGRDSTARMSLATIRRAAERLRDDGLLGPELSVVWHAGEPLTLPAAYFDDAIALLHEVLGASCTLSHSMQTNAMLVDDARCAMIRRHAIRIGVSVDGPADLHDAHRRTRQGHGTHAQVLRGMHRLREHGIGFHAIAVVTAATLAQPDAFVDFFEAEGVHELGCNFDEAEGLHARSSLAGREAAHAAFLARLLERTSASGCQLRIREFAQAQQLIAQGLPSQAWRGRHWPDNAQTLPFALVSVAHDGGFGTFSPELLGQRSAEFGDFVFGNVHRESYLDSSTGAAFMRAWQAIVRGTQGCEAACAHFAFCGGGAPANKLYENGDFASTETLYCRSVLKRPFDAVLARLERASAGAPA